MAERVKVSDALEKLKSQLEEFEKIREAVEASVESAGRLLPDLKKQKERLQADMDEGREKIRQIDDTMMKLENGKKELEDDLQRMEKQVLDLDEKIEFISENREGRRF